VLGKATPALYHNTGGTPHVLYAPAPRAAARYAPRAAQAQKLLSPAEMGEIFKVLAVGRGVARPLLGFASGERSHTL
jgi:SAM-dependent MidA family methyltransferase